jgi:hypothetical protein
VTLPDSIEPDQLKLVAIIALVVLGIITLFVLRFIRKMFVRVVFAGVLLAAAIIVYVQRDDLDRCQERLQTEAVSGTADECTCTFAGLEVTVPRCPVRGSPRDG